MEMALLIKFMAAFAFVIGLMLLMSWGMKKAGLSGTSLLPGGAKRRLRVVEYLPLDHRRKLVLVRCDDKEHLIVLGPTSETVVERNIPVSLSNEMPVEIVKEQKIVQI